MVLHFDFFAICCRLQEVLQEGRPQSHSLRDLIAFLIAPIVHSSPDSGCGPDFFDQHLANAFLGLVERVPKSMLPPFC
ncbi:MAG: hypothetical protein MZV49_12110 [Rhodopseudomonas palustris]|nr:hypothetical protein [Rhodopseudomonas palustris]